MFHHRIIASLCSCLFTLLVCAQTSDNLAFVSNPDLDTDKKIKILSALADSLSRSDFEQFLSVTRQGVQLMQIKKDKYLLPWFLLQHACAHQLKQQFDSSAVFLHHAITGFHNISSKKGLAHSHLRLAFNHLSTGNFQSALKNDLKALQLYKALDDESGIAKSMVSISNDLYYQEQFEEGAEYAEQAILKFQKLKDEKELASAYQYAGDNYLQLKEYDKALYYMNQAVKIQRKLDAHPVNLGSLLNARGNVHKYMEQYDSAINDYKESLAIVEDLNHKAGIAATMANIADVYIRMKKYRMALSFILKTIEIQEENSLRAHLPEGYLHASHIYEALKDYESALGYYRKYKLTGDTLLSIEKDKIMSELLTQHQTKEKEAIIAAQKEKIRQQKLVQILFAGIVALLALVLFLGYRAFRQREKHNVLLSTAYQQLNAKNQENELLLKEIHHRVKNNLQTISSLLNIQSAAVKNPEVLEAVKASQNRVQCMALLHQKLYQGKNLASVEMKSYFESIGKTLVNSFAEKNKSITLNVPMQKLTLDIDTAIPVGLMTNELVTNALKYAFEGKKKGEIQISLIYVNENELELLVSDNGIGMPEAGNKGQQGSSGFGTRLINLLSMQLGGTLRQFSEKGTQTVIRFKYEQPDT